jgi:CPA2 family monovalent cation:H+ antiporter-2
MIEQPLLQALLLLGTAVLVVLIFHRLKIPSSLGYLLVGVLLSANTAGPVLPVSEIQEIAEFGIVFLLFTIGLSFSLAQIHALRHTILGAGTAQVALTTLVIAALAWACGVDPVTAFIAGAVCAQSSTTVITRQLAEQKESQARHARLATSMSVFQDVTAVPFVVIIPVLGVAGASAIMTDLGLALLKAVVAFAVVLVSGRYLLKPLFHLVAERRSAELFTLTVLFVSLIAAWTTSVLGLSMAFGAFLAGMVLSETEYRHQIEATIRPFRDVLLGLFFISIGMLFDPFVLPDIWLETLAVLAALLLVKILLVTAIVRFSGQSLVLSVRTALVLAVGGEFGFALIAIGYESSGLDPRNSQILLSAVLFSIVLAPFIIRGNEKIAHLLGGSVKEGGEDPKPPELHLAGQPVYYADATQASVLETAGVESAALVVISHNDTQAALETLHQLSLLRPDGQTLVRAADERCVQALKDAGATEVVPEMLEAGMVMVSHSLLSLHVPLQRVSKYWQEQRVSRYPLLHELFRGGGNDGVPPDNSIERLHSVVIDQSSPAVGQSLSQVMVDEVPVSVVTLVRDGRRYRYPPADQVLQAGDVLVLLGLPRDIERVQAQLTGESNPV